MGPETYDDILLFNDELTIINSALDNVNEIDDSPDESNDKVLPRDKVINTKEDLARLCLIKIKNYTFSNL